MTEWLLPGEINGLVPDDNSSEWTILEPKIKVDMLTTEPDTVYYLPVDLANEFNKRATFCSGRMQTCWVITESRSHRRETEIIFFIDVNLKRCRVISPEAKQTCLLKLKQAWENTCIAIKRRISEHTTPIGNSYAAPRHIRPRDRKFGMPTCSQCGKENLDHYFTSRRDGRCLCSACFKERKEKKLAKEVSNERTGNA